MAIKVVLFDLGGVIIRLGEHIFPPHWLMNNSSFSLQEWLRSPTAKEFEIGAIGTQQFAQTLKMDLALQQSEEQIIQRFTAWPEALFPTAVEMLTSLKGAYTIAALSNINELHAPRMRGEFDLNRYFDDLYFSNELGLAKPNPDIYLKVVELLEVAPQEDVFFDDVKANVEAALDVGLHAHQVFGPDSVRAHLTKY